MTTPQEGFRKARAVTVTLVALGVVGTVAGSVLAYADTHSSASESAVSPPAADSGSSASSAAPQTTDRAAPSLTKGSGRVDGRSSGS